MLIKIPLICLPFNSNGIENKRKAGIGKCVVSDTLPQSVLVGIDVPRLLETLQTRSTTEFEEEEEHAALGESFSGDDKKSYLGIANQGNHRTWCSK